MIYETNKSVLKIVTKNKHKYFHKELKNNNLDEIEGYNIVSKLYNVPKRINIIGNEIVYEYKEELISNTLHEYIYQNKIEKINYENIMVQIKQNYLNKALMKESKCKNIKFFKNRTDILEKYKRDKIFKQVYCYKGINYNPINIINEVIKVLNEDKELTSYITLGDPTDTNISTTGIFTDFENGGYNSVIGEIAISFASFLTHGGYFYPKYNKEAYLIRPYILDNYYKYEPEYINNEIILKCNKKSYEIIKNILNIYTDLDTNEVRKYLKYYICMRILTPIDVLKMEEKDKRYIILYLIYIYHNIESIEDILKIIGEAYEF